MVNNVNATAQIFKNKGKGLQPDHHSIQLQLVGKGKNTGAIGTQIQVKAGDQVFYTEQMPNRGFQSSVDPKITIGLGKVTLIDEIKVLWPDGSFTQMTKVPVDQLLKLSWAEAGVLPEGSSFFPAPSPAKFVKASNPGLDFMHQENEFVDFDRDRLTYLMLSTEGPAFAKGDVNGDGLEDLFFGGAKTFPGKLYLAKKGGGYSYKAQESFDQDAISEDTDALFFDADKDGDADLFVTSGGNESGFGSLDLADRLYLNDGKGNFTKGFNTGLVGIFGSRWSARLSGGRKTYPLYLWGVSGYTAMDQRWKRKFHRTIRCFGSWIEDYRNGNRCKGFGLRWRWAARSRVSWRMDGPNLL